MSEFGPYLLSEKGGNCIPELNQIGLGLDFVLGGGKREREKGNVFIGMGGNFVFFSLYIIRAFVSGFF